MASSAASRLAKLGHGFPPPEGGHSVKTPRACRMDSREVAASRIGDQLKNRSVVDDGMDDRIEGAGTMQLLDPELCLRDIERVVAFRIT
jgi:hypothetical protein